ncbi:MAG: SDR family NAD(P)-dependent oxidoreductase [Candidatus Dojkabacteria bacterium]
MKLTGKTILITGASSGIGKAAALRFAKDKCNLILAARNLKDLNTVKTSCEQLGSSVKVVVCDVTKEDDIKNMFKDIGTLDAVFNNAGLGFDGKIFEQESSKIKTLVDVNVLGMILVTKYASEIMVKQKYGHIIMTSSVAGLVPVPGFSVYAATKWAITGFTSSVRRELLKNNVKVSSLHPGRINTFFWKRGGINSDETTMSSADSVANAVYRALFTNTYKIYVPFYIRVIYLVYRWFPWLVEFFLNNIG